MELNNLSFAPHIKAARINGELTVAEKDMLVASLANNESCFLHIGMTGIADLSFLQPVLHKIKRLWIRSENCDWEAIAGCSNVMFLKIDGHFKTSLDMSGMTGLEEMQVFYNGGYNNSYQNLPNLTYIKMQGFKGEDLSVFGSLSQLKDLDLVDARRLKSLKGIEGIEQLNSLSFLSPTKLSDISSIQDINVNWFVLDGGKKVNDFSYVAQNKNLRDLGLFNCGELQSLNFLLNSNIKSLALFDTKVADGNISQLIESKSLQRIDGKNKRNFDMKIAELNKRLEEKNGAYYDDFYPESRRWNEMCELGLV